MVFLKIPMVFQSVDISTGFSGYIHSFLRIYLQVSQDISTASSEYIFSFLQTVCKKPGSVQGIKGNMAKFFSERSAEATEPDGQFHAPVIMAKNNPLTELNSANGLFFYV